MKQLYRKIKFWCWWKFKATEKQKLSLELLYYGTSFMKNGKRIDPMKIYKLSK